MFCGAKATQSFTVTNKVLYKMVDAVGHVVYNDVCGFLQGSSSAELTFNLAHLPDFSLLLPSSEDPYSESIASYSTSHGVFLQMSQLLDQMVLEHIVSISLESPAPRANSSSVLKM